MRRFVAKKKVWIPLALMLAGARAHLAALLLDGIFALGKPNRQQQAARWPLVISSGFGSLRGASA